MRAFTLFALLMSSTAARAGGTPPDRVTVLQKLHHHFAVRSNGELRSRETRKLYYDIVRKGINKADAATLAVLREASNSHGLSQGGSPTRFAISGGSNKIVVFTREAADKVTTQIVVDK